MIFVVRGDRLPAEPGGAVMTTATTDLVPSHLDVTRLAVESFLARYREPTLTAYTQDLKAYLGWCQQCDREVLRVTRGELEMYVRHLEGRGYAAATVARRFGTVANFYKYAVIDGVLPANPAAAVTRPKVPWEGTEAHRAAPAGVRCTARRRPKLRAQRPRAGLPARDARAARVGSLRDRHHRPPLRGRLRAAARARQGRQAGRHPTAHPGAARGAGSRRQPRHGADPADPQRAADGPAGASRALTRVAHAAGITRPISPHGLRRTFCTTGLVAGTSIRDMQYAMRHADPRTTMRYDMAKANLDRHAAHAVAAYLAGMSTG